MRKLTALLAVGLICVFSSSALAMEAEIEISDYPNAIDGTGSVVLYDGMLLNFTVSLKDTIPSLVAIELKGFMHEVGNEEWTTNYKSAGVEFTLGSDRNKLLPINTPDIVFDSFTLHDDLYALVDQWNIDNPPPEGVDPVTIQPAMGRERDNYQVWDIMPGGSHAAAIPSADVSGNIATFTYEVVDANAVLGKTYAFFLDESWSTAGTSLWVSQSNFSSGTAWDFTNSLTTNAFDMFVLDPLTFDDGLITFAPVLVPALVTVAAEPPGSGLEVIVDGDTYSAPHTFTWYAGSTHTIEAVSPQPVNAVGTKYVFNSWSDGGQQSHEIMPEADITVTASFDTWHQLTVSVDPPEAEVAGCSVDVDPQGEGDAWYPEGTDVQLTAVPAPGWHFVQWSDGDANPTRSITMDSPASYTAEVLRYDLRADLLIKADTERNAAYAEDAVYYPEPAGDQIKAQPVRDGGAAIYQIKVQNDSLIEWSFLVRGGKGSDAGWSVGYLVGPRNITPEITGPDGYETGFLAPGECKVITLVMTPTRYAIVGESESESATVEVFEDSTDPTVRDSVQAVAEKLMPLDGDVNGDNCVNVADLMAVRANLGRGSGCP